MRFQTTSRCSLLGPLLGFAFLMACGSSSETATSSSGVGGFITGASASSNAASSSSANASSSTSGSGSGGATGGAGGSGAAGGAGGNAGGAPPQCQDLGVGEPNETEENAMPLGEQTDCASSSGVTGVVAANDHDWFRYDGDDGLCAVNPSREFTQDGGLRLCKYFECVDSNNTTVDCPSGTSAAVSPGGRQGCCSTSGFQLSTLGGVNCTGTLDDSATVYLSVSAVSPTPATCAAYSLTYAF